MRSPPISVFSPPSSSDSPAPPIRPSTPSAGEPPPGFRRYPLSTRAPADLRRRRVDLTCRWTAQQPEMASSIATPVHPPSPHVVGRAFVQQYYEMLYLSRGMVYRFYQDSSIVGRPNTDGTMTSVTTMKAINEMILSFDYKYIEVESVDSQSSYNWGVFTVVIGLLTKGDHVRQKFTQTFVLAPQENGVYFVQNDMFRFLDESQPRQISQMLVFGTHDVLTAAVTLAPDLNPGKDEEVLKLSKNGCSGAEDEVVVEQKVHANISDPVPVHVDQSDALPVHVNQSKRLPVPEVSASVSQEDFTSVVKSMKGSKLPVSANVPPAKARVTPVNPEKPLIIPTNIGNPEKEEKLLTTKPAPTPEASVLSNNNVPDTNNVNEVEDHSIFIPNLPLNAKAEEVEKIFKRFGPIKRGGVQVRSHKVNPYCFGFVEFETLNSMQAAIEASPVTMGDCQVYVHKKRTTTQGVSNSLRGRFAAARGAFHNGSFRGRANFMSNQGYRGSEYRNAEYSGRGQGGRGHARNGFQWRVLQNGDDRKGQPNGIQQPAVST